MSDFEMLSLFCMILSLVLVAIGSVVTLAIRTRSKSKAAILRQQADGYYYCTEGRSRTKSVVPSCRYYII